MRRELVCEALLLRAWALSGRRARTACWIRHGDARTVGAADYLGRLFWAKGMVYRGNCGLASSKRSATSVHAFSVIRSDADFGRVYASDAVMVTKAAQ